MVANTPFASSNGFASNRSGSAVPTTGRSRLAALVREPLQFDVQTVGARVLLDHVQDGLTRGGTAAERAIAELFEGLHVLRGTSEPGAWREIVRLCAEHPVRELVHHDPFTARSFHKPRGYAGDAVLIDYIYGGDPGSAGASGGDVSDLGRKIFGYTTSAPASAGVRTRRDLMAAIIDQACSTADRPHILSVACGHLREATLCRSVRAGLAGRFVALDQDEASLDVVRDQAGEHGVVTVCSSIKALFRGELAGERFDLIYSTGLYDYLDDRIGTRLTARLFQMLNPGGRLVVANFLPDIYCAGFMETFMGWDLIYRTPEQVDALASGIPAAEIAGRRTYVERNANIAFLDLVRE